MISISKEQQTFSKIVDRVNVKGPSYLFTFPTLGEYGVPAALSTIKTFFCVFEKYIWIWDVLVHGTPNSNWDSKMRYRGHIQSTIHIRLSHLVTQRCLSPGVEQCGSHLTSQGSVKLGHIRTAALLHWECLTFCTDNRVTTGPLFLDYIKLGVIAGQMGSA